MAPLSFEISSLLSLSDFLGPSRLPPIFFHPIPIFLTPQPLIISTSRPLYLCLSASQPFTSLVHFLLPLIIFHSTPSPACWDRRKFEEWRPGMGCEGLSWQHLQEGEGRKTLPVPSHPFPLLPSASPSPSPTGLQ